jgi:hypothetical protein
MLHGSVGDRVYLPICLTEHLHSHLRLVIAGSWTQVSTDDQPDKATVTVLSNWTIEVNTKQRTYLV